MKWIFIFLFLIGCKTQEEIRREELVNSLANQMRQGQNVNANMTVEVAELKKQILQLQGMIEESGQANQQSHETRLTDLFSRVQVLEEKFTTMNTSIEKQSAAIEQLKNQVGDQGKYLDNLLKTLKNINSVPKSSSAAKKNSKNQRSDYEEAMFQYSKGRYQEARSLLGKLENSKSYKGKARARILHNLGMCEHLLKNDENALVYFSKLYSEQPKSAYNANGLLWMAKSFKRLKRKDEAKATLEELINNFPKSKKVSEAQKLIKAL